MSVGASLYRKNAEDFMRLAAATPNTQFDLYPSGHGVDELESLNAALGYPINIVPPVEPEDMPAEYKKHRWLVLTESREVGTRGWPVSVAEAQASGVGVCVSNTRPDLREYVGSAGFLYDSIGEVASIISKPFPEEMRRLGFIQAKKSDIFEHKRILTDLWAKAVGCPSRSRDLVRNADDRIPDWGEGETGLEQHQRMYLATRELEDMTPLGHTLIIADNPAQWGIDTMLTGRRVVPFLEHEGLFWGKPEDDAVAIQELERLRTSGASFMVFAWPAFWWLDYYSGLHQHLRSNFRCVLENERLVIFDLRS
jgi:hypothetical protein